MALFDPHVYLNLSIHVYVLCTYGQRTRRSSAKRTALLAQVSVLDPREWLSLM